MDIEVSQELKDLYNILKKIDSEDNKGGFYYYKYVVHSGNRDYLFLLLNILKDMEKKGYKFD